MLDPCNSFLDSEPEVDADCLEDTGVDDLIVGDLDTAGTLFACLFTGNSNPDSINILPDIMSSTSDYDSDGISNYLSSTQESSKTVTDHQETVPDESVPRKQTRSLNQLASKNNSPQITSKQSVYSRPPLMCSSTVNTKNPRVEIEKLNLQTRLKFSSSTSAKCMNKSAIVARENREKKKKYIQELETNFEEMKLQNCDLQSKLINKSKQCKSLQKEIQYLRNVLANQSSISALLKNIHSTQGLSFSSSIELSDESENTTNKKRKLDENDNYDNKKINGVYVRATGSHKKTKEDTVTEDYSPPLTPVSNPEESAGGVCLHVNNNKVSLELCSKCAENASNAWNKAGDHTYFKN